MTFVADAGGAERFLGTATGVLAITAGRQEYEAEPGAEGIPPGAQDLHLYSRTEALFDAHPDLRAAHERLQGWVREAERYHRLRLDSAMRAADSLWRETSDSATLREHRAQTIRQLRTLDRQHLRQIASVRERFQRSLNLELVNLIAVSRAEMVREIRGATTLVIAGGHVTVLLNRLLLFDLARELASSRVIAWGAGAMACTERVLLFDDRGPLGPRIPEFLGNGLRIGRGAVILPGARQRMMLSDKARIGILCRRLSPASGLIIDSDGYVRFRGGKLVAHQGVHRLTATGRVSRLRRE